MNLENQKRPAVLLFNPFVFIAGAPALLLGLGVILLAAFFGSVSNTHFDGVLDTHTGRAVPWWFFLSEGVMDWVCLSLVLLIIGRILSKTPFRTIDLLGTQALARWPTLIIALLALPPAVQRFSNYLAARILHTGGAGEFNTADGVFFGAFTLGTILLVCWMVALMYMSFSFSCNVRGGRSAVGFIVGIIIAEILSKLAVYGMLSLSLAGPPTSGAANSITSEARSDSAAVTAAQNWLAGIDAGDYSESWRDASAFFQERVTSNDWMHSMETYRKPLGSLTSRSLKSSQTLSQLPGAPDGQYVLMQFDTSFSEKTPSIETVTFLLEKDGQWKAAGYFIK